MVTSLSVDVYVNASTSLNLPWVWLGKSQSNQPFISVEWFQDVPVECIGTYTL